MDFLISSSIFSWDTYASEQEVTVTMFSLECLYWVMKYHSMIIIAYCGSRNWQEEMTGYDKAATSNPDNDV